MHSSVLFLHLFNRPLYVYKIISGHNLTHISVTTVTDDYMKPFTIFWRS